MLTEEITVVTVDENQGDCTIEVGRKQPLDNLLSHLFRSGHQQLKLGEVVHYLLSDLLDDEN